MRAYAPISHLNAKIMSKGHKFGDNLVLVDVTGQKADRAGLLASLFHRGFKIVAVKGEYYVAKQRKTVHAIAVQTTDHSLDLHQLLWSNYVPILGGYRSKVLIRPQDQKKAFHYLNEAYG